MPNYNGFLSSSQTPKIPNRPRIFKIGENTNLLGTLNDRSMSFENIQHSQSRSITSLVVDFDTTCAGNKV